jgi:hypothetical protein
METFNINIFQTANFNEDQITIRLVEGKVKTSDKDTIEMYLKKKMRQMKLIR